MEMISVAKLRNSAAQLFMLKRYCTRLENLLKNVTASAHGVHPLLVERTARKIGICVITSDTGLCGAYNHAMFSAVEAFLKKFPAENIVLTSVGRKGTNFFRRKRIGVQQSFIELHGRYEETMGEKIITTLTDSFLQGKIDEAYVAYSFFESNVRHKPVIEKIIPLTSVAEKTVDYIFEPDAKTLMDQIIPLYLKNKIRMCFLNAFASENSARVVAMGEATKNAKELLENLTLQRNKLRQAGITKEILEIVSAKEALKG